MPSPETFAAGRAYADPRVSVYIGGCLERMRQLHTGSVDSIVTSPPYFGLRDYYGHDEQIGMEGEMASYVAALVAVFAEAARVLKPTGVLWLNLGDTYNNTTSNQNGTGASTTVTGGKHDHGGARRRTRPAPHLPVKTLLGVPWTVALALRDAGWLIRSDVIWAKPNPMPESVKDRPTKAHEYVFMLTRSPRHYYDAAAVAEPAVRAGEVTKAYSARKADGGGERQRTAPGTHEQTVGETRNRRTVWTISGSGYKGAHFAVMPAGLAEVCILSSTPPHGIILDPFAGSGTVAEVALRLGRRAILIELNPEYLPLIVERIGKA